MRVELVYGGDGSVYVQIIAGSKQEALVLDSIFAEAPSFNSEIIERWSEPFQTGAFGRRDGIRSVMLERVEVKPELEGMDQ